MQSRVLRLEHGLVLMIVVCFAAFVLVRSSESTDGHPAQRDFLGNKSCAEVKKLFVDKRIGLDADTVDTSHDDEVPLCSSSWNASCCTPAMERRYAEASKKEFQKVLQSSNAFLHATLASAATTLREHFLEMIHASENNTHVLFSEVYKRMAGVARAPVTQLYAELGAHFAGAPAPREDLEGAVGRFFDALFPLVYHRSINPKLRDFSADYEECLRQTRREIRPFGDIAERVAGQVSKSFSVARTVLEALETGAEVVSATGHLHFRSACGAGLTRLTSCASCGGRPDGAVACGGFCLNVVRGCLAHVAELDQPWADLVSALERVTSGLVASANVEEVLAALDTKVSEAIMYAMENGPDLSRKVKVACGHPSRSARDVSEHPGPVAGGPAGRIVPVRSPEESLFAKLQSVVQRLAESKGHFANLADAVCSDESWAVREEGQCWNGQHIGQYTHTIAGVGVSAQKYNPEMNVPEADDLVVMSLDEKLQKISRLLRASILPDVPQADSYVVEGSGSGIWPRSQVGDDEDYDNGSGSGDWGAGPRSASDFNFDSNENRDVNIKVKEGSSGAPFASSCLMTLSAALLVKLLSRALIPAQPL